MMITLIITDQANDLIRHMFSWLTVCSLIPLFYLLPDSDLFFFLHDMHNLILACHLYTYLEESN